MFQLILATAGMFFASYLTATRLKLVSLLDRFLAAGLIFLSGQLIILLFNGVVVHRLDRGTILFFVLTWLFIELLFNPVCNDLTSLMKSVTGYYRKYLSVIPSVYFQNRLNTCVGIILFLSLFITILGVIYLPPHAWDEIWYHLPPVAAWFKQGYISQLPMSVIWEEYDPAEFDLNQLAQDFSVAFNWSNVYPLNVELNALWIMLLTGNDLLVEAAQVFYIFLGTLATFGLCRLCGSRDSTSFLMAMLFILTPMILIQMRVAYVDAAFGSMVAAALYLFLKWQKQPEISYALLLGLATGLMMGIKPNGIAFAAVIFLSFSFWLYKFRGTKEIGLGLQITVIFLAIILTGSFWYLRTFWYYGNPIYPVKIDFPGLSLPGMGSVGELFMFHNTPEDYRNRNPLINIANSWLELGNETYNYYSRTRGFGPAWASLALPAVVPFAVNAWRLRNIPLLWMLGLTAVMLALQPAVWWPRYALYIVPVGLAALAWVYDRLPVSFKKITAVILILNLTVSTSLVLSENLGKLSAVLLRPTEYRSFGQLYFNDYAWVDEIPPSNIGHTPMAWIYPFYGGLRHNVKLVDGKSAVEFQESITGSGIEYLVIKKGFRDYESWANSLTDTLTVYMKGERIVVYQVGKEE